MKIFNKDKKQELADLLSDGDTPDINQPPQIEAKLETAQEQINTMADLQNAAMVANMERRLNMEISPTLFDYLANKSNRPGQPKTESITFMDVRLFRQGDMDRILNLESQHMDTWSKYQLEKQRDLDAQKVKR